MHMMKQLMQTISKKFEQHSFRKYRAFDDVDLDIVIGDTRYRISEREDIVSFLTIERDVYAGETPWTFSHFEHEIMKNDRAMFLTAESDGRIVGFIGARMIPETASVHLSNLAVLTAYQRQGIGANLVIGMCDLMQLLGAETITLEVMRDNMTAQAMYRQLGFETTEILPDYYENQLDGLWMVKKLGALNDRFDKN